MNTTRVLALLPLFVVLVHSFSWEIVVGAGKQLQFYNNGTLVHTEDNPSSKDIYAVTYDPIHSRVLFLDSDHTNMTISSFDQTTRKIQTLITRITSTVYKHLAYDPITQLLFWSEDKEIYSLSLKPASNKAFLNLIVTSDDNCKALAVDSCGGYIYWATHKKIERAAFDGSAREVLIDYEYAFLSSLAIDHHTQKMYWIAMSEVYKKRAMYIRHAEPNGKTVTTIYSKGIISWDDSLVISKDYIYWRSSDEGAIMKLPKNQQLDVQPIVYSISSRHSVEFHLTAVNYTIMEWTLGTKTCEALKSLIIPN